MGYAGDTSQEQTGRPAAPAGFRSASAGPRTGVTPPRSAGGGGYTPPPAATPRGAPPRGISNLGSAASNAGYETAGYGAQRRLGKEQDGIWDLINSLLGPGGGGSGGGGGGGGGGMMDMSPAIRAKYNQIRQDSGDRKNRADGEIGGLYDKLAGTYAPIEGQTKASYDGAIQQNVDGTNSLIQETNRRLAEEAAKQSTAYSALGVDGPTASGAQTDAQQGLMDIAETSTNWNGLLTANQQTQMSRDRLDHQGALDAGTIARKELTTSYEDYLRELGQQESQELSGAMVPVGGGGGGGRSGGGGGGGSSDDPYTKLLKTGMLTKAMADLGMYGNAWSVSGYKPPAAPSNKLTQYGISQEQFAKSAAQFAAANAGGSNAFANAVGAGADPLSAFLMSRG